jgi:PIN domain nuclease of toxin-antitoxin system
MMGNGFQTIAILPEHTNVLTTMPFHHRDPFDRLMVAQAIAEGMDLVSADGVLDQYPVTRHW